MHYATDTKIHRLETVLQFACHVSSLGRCGRNCLTGGTSLRCNRPHTSSARVWGLGGGSGWGLWVGAKPPPTAPTQAPPNPHPPAPCPQPQDGSLRGLVDLSRLRSNRRDRLPNRADNFSPDTVKTSFPVGDHSHGS